MCPDAELISAYADGEVPSPWRERLAEHLESCPDCAGRLAAFTELGNRLSLEGEEERALVDRVSSRVSSRLAPRFAALEARQGQNLVSRLRPLARRSISLPLPFAAAAALALVFFTGLGLSALLRPAPLPMASAAAADISPGSAQGASMEALLRYLEAQDAQVNLTIRLPQSATYASTGSPLIVTAPPPAYAPYPLAVEGTGPSSLQPEAAPPAGAEDPALGEAAPPGISLPPAEKALVPGAGAAKSGAP